MGRDGPSAGSDFGPERGKDADCVIGSAGRGEGARFVAAAKGKKRKLVVQIPKENNRFWVSLPLVVTLASRDSY